mgnify:CR=1 FL=1
MNRYQQIPYAMSPMVSLPLVQGVYQDYDRMARLAEFSRLSQQILQRSIENARATKFASLAFQQTHPELQMNNMQMGFVPAPIKTEVQSDALRRPEPLSENTNESVHSEPFLSEAEDKMGFSEPSVKEQLPLSLQTEEKSSIGPKEQKQDGNPMEITDIVKTRQYDAHYGRVIMEQFTGQDKAFVTFYPNFTAQDEIRQAELEEMAANFSQNGKIERRETIKSSFVKNFAKMSGDHFAIFASSKYKVESLKKIFKDKSSCSKLNEYLSGKRKVPKMSVMAFIKLYFEYIQEIDLEYIDNTKIGARGLRTCYKLIFSYLKSVLAALREWDLLDKINAVEIEKFWPNVELSVKWE